MEEVIQAEAAPEVAETPPKRKRGRPPKAKPVVENPVEGQSPAPPKYSDADWYLSKPDRNDDEHFDKILDRLREKNDLEVLNIEVVDSIRLLVEPPIGHWQFTPDGLASYALAIRGPFVHDGRLTPGGLLKARVLLCRDHQLAGTLATLPASAPMQETFGTQVLQELRSRDGREQ